MNFYEKGLKKVLREQLKICINRTPVSLTVSVEERVRRIVCCMLNVDTK